MNNRVPRNAQIALLAGVGLLLSHAVSAQGVAQVDRLLIQQKTAHAQFQLLDPTGCIETDGLIQIGNSMQHQPPSGPASFAFVSVTLTKANLCTGEFLIETLGFGGPDTPVSIASDLSTASIHGTIPAIDFVTNQTVNVVVDLTWTGFGGVQHDVENTHDRSTPGFNIVSHFNGDTQPATVAGTILVGTTNFAVGPLVDARIENAKTGDLTVQKK